MMEERRKHSRWVDGWYARGEKDIKTDKLLTLAEERVRHLMASARRDAHASPLQLGSQHSANGRGDEGEELGTSVLMSSILSSGRDPPAAPASAPRPTIDIPGGGV